MTLEHLSANVGRLSRARVSVRVGNTAQDAIESPRTRWQTNVVNQTNQHPRVNAPSFAIKYERLAGQCQIEGMVLRMRDVRRL